MEQKIKPHFGTLVFYIISGLGFIAWGINIEYPEVVIFLYFIGLIFLGGAYPLAMYQAKSNFKQKEAKRIRKEELERRRSARIEENNRKQKVYDEKVSEFVKKYGNISKTITFGETSNFMDNVIFFNDAKVVVINGHDIPFNQIISFQHADNKRTVKGATTYRTETDTADMFGRSSIGYLLDGKRGEDIGAKTAAKNTTVHHQPDKVYYNHEIIVTIDSLDFPIQRIKIGSYKNQAEELQSLFTIIINRNSNK